MKIAIIGSGWVGCHLANEWCDEHEITIFEKENHLFSKTSLHSQNRLHLGYHYCRDEKTRNLCVTTYNRFLKDYRPFTREIKNNLYCIANSSAITKSQFDSIFKKHNLLNSSDFLVNQTSATYITDERYIDSFALYNHFNTYLPTKTVVIITTVLNTSDLVGFDYIIDCSNNFVKPQENTHFEHTVTWTYSIKKPIPWGAITVVDGPFFSLFPYKDGISLGHVKYSSLEFSDTPHSFVEDYNLFNDNRKLAEDDVRSYLSDFDSYLEYSGYYSGIKSKPKNDLTADRYPRIKRDHNVFHCFTGKIQGIYPIQDELESLMR
jgi:hypothetical protein